MEIRIRTILIVLFGALPFTILAPFCLLKAGYSLTFFLGGYVDGVSVMKYVVYGVAVALGTIAVWRGAMKKPSTYMQFGLIAGIFGLSSITYHLLSYSWQFKDLFTFLVAAGPNLVLVYLLFESRTKHPSHNNVLERTGDS